MFWNDPILYGATLPYRDIHAQLPFAFNQMPFNQIPLNQIPVNPMVWNDVQKLVPPMYGVVPQFYPPVLQDPLIQAKVPFMPHMMNLNLPMYGFYRPF